MARAESRWMTPALLISSATLLIPTREASIIAVVAAAALVALFWMVKRYRVNPISFQTAEGRWALAVLFAAPLILIGRTALLYQIDAFAGFCFSVIVYALSYRVFKRSAAGSIIEIISFCFAVITLVATVTSLTYAVCDLLSALFPRTVDWYGYPVRRVYVESAMPGLWGSLLLFATHSFIAKRSPWKLSRAVNILATVAVAIVLSLHLLFDSGLSAALIINSALLGTCLVVNFKHSRYVEGVVVLLAFSVIFLINLSGLMDFAMNTGWWGLAVAGMLAIFSGALLERSLARPAAAA